MSLPLLFPARPVAPAAARVWPSFLSECRSTLRLAFPLIAGQLGQMLMGVIDTIMIGRLGVVPLGAATFANTLVTVPFVLGIGLLSAVSVRVSQARGASDPRAAREAVRHATALALSFSLLVIWGFVALLPFLSRFHQPPEVTAATPQFLLLIAASLVPAMLYLTWKNHADAMHRPWPPFWIVLGGVLLNASLNWFWIYGHGGFPPLGILGAGYATLVARSLTALVLFFWLQKAAFFHDWWPRKWWRKFQLRTFAHLLAIGFPASLHLLTEVGAFATASLLIGTLGAVPLAAHQVAITCAAMAFMVPLGVAMAVTVRVGEVAGAGESARLHRVLAGGWLFALCFMIASTSLFLFGGNWIAAHFVDDPAVRQIAARLLVVAGIFQLFDGQQVISSGALRGLDDVRTPAFIALLAYWGIALPTGAALSFHFGWGALGMWTGLAIGLATAAGALGWRAWQRFGAPVQL